MKNAFYFILKALLVLKIFKCLLRLFGHVVRTAWLKRLTSKLMTSQHGLQTIAIHIYWQIFHKIKATRQRNLDN